MSEPIKIYSAKFVYGFNDITVTECLKLAKELEGNIGKAPSYFLFDAGFVKYNESDADLLLDGTITETEYMERNWGSEFPNSLSE